MWGIGLKERSDMPLQNRVDPFGDIHAVAARGLFTGNRGVIHDPDSKTLLKRRWTTKAWLICDCEFGGRRRDVMGRNGPNGHAGWTELFFLDEVTALAAGHRPCFFCRREDAERFRAAWARAHGGERPSAPDMDAVLHRERLPPRAGIKLAATDLASLPDGAVIASASAAFTIRGGAAFRWTEDTYVRAALPPAGLTLLTPTSTLAAITAGYRPVIHPSAIP